PRQDNLRKSYLESHLAAIVNPVCQQGLVETTIRTFGKVDVLVNNAAIYIGGTILESDIKSWDALYRVNQLGVFLGMRAVLEPMKRAGSGSIVNVSSHAATSNVPGYFSYGTSKWAVRGMTKLSSTELAPLGIRVNTVFPGIIDTPMLHKNNSPERIAFYDSLIPLGRRGAPEEIASVVLFLASEASSYMTGAELLVDGGIG
ncbi:SDR family NAD(P)-dependent oxidoreductase, partial [Croceicoccus pelagius]|uniref:SDR family NAD(P)-dependent oxidoreductase n=1 Tax=Croceicoccus pelagius TaxID=1703341 RepID=UPI0016670236